MVIKIIEKLKAEKISKTEIIYLLKARKNVQKHLFEQAQEIRQKFFENKVFVRGVIEISNYCRMNCNYCAMRYSNKELQRYRLGSEEIFSLAKQIKDLNIKTLFLQSGEDTYIDGMIEKVLTKIKKELKINEIILGLGNRSRNQYKRFKDAGADAYILKFETSDSKFFKSLRSEPLGKRLYCLNQLKELGFKIGAGNITGLPGQKIKTIVGDILLAKRLNTDFVSTAPFIPNENTVYENESPGNLDLALNTIAILRILLKKVSIPTVSAFEKIEKGGQLRGLEAGANVITVNFTPPQIRKKYAIYSKDRFVVSMKHAFGTIRECGLISA